MFKLSSESNFAALPLESLTGSSDMLSMMGVVGGNGGNWSKLLTRVCARYGIVEMRGDSAHGLDWDARS